MVMHLTRQYNVAEILLDRLTGFDGAGAPLPEPAARCVTHQLGCSQPSAMHVCCQCLLSTYNAAAATAVELGPLWLCSELCHILLQDLLCALDDSLSVFLKIWSAGVHLHAPL